MTEFPLSEQQTRLMMGPPRAYEAPAVVEAFMTLISMSLYTLLSIA